MRKYYLLTYLLLAALLTACGSSPRNDYYRLTAKIDAVPQGESPSLGIGPIEIPAYLDREKLVYAQDGNQVRLATVESWAEPLDAGVERVMALNLSGLLDTQNVRTFPWHPRRAPQYAVKLNLLTLDADDTEAMLTAEWLVYRPEGSDTVERRISHLRRPLAAGNTSPANLPAAYSELLYDLATEIAEAIKADTGPEDARAQSQGSS